MPAKAGVSKSEEVRRLFKNGTKSAPEIVAHLKSRGIDVAHSQVYQVLSTLKSKRGRKAKASKVSDAHDTIIDTAVVFVRQAGGMSKARELLSKLATLRD